MELDPRRLTSGHVEAFARMGVRRASFGVQDCDPAVQRAIHREQPHAMNVTAMELLRANGFESVNIDLIYGLPLQSRESVERTMDQVLGLGADRFSVFNYAHVPWMRPAQNLLERSGLPDAGTKQEVCRLIGRRLSEAGYVSIGMDHYALPGDALVQAQRSKSLQRNFQGYSTRRGVEICGFGIEHLSREGRIPAEC